MISFVAAARRYSALLAAAALASAYVAPRPTPRSTDPRTAAAEALIDAFYSFEPARLRRALATAPSSAPQILYYQGWAEGGNYVILNRRTCRATTAEEVQCEITVRDDLIAALGTKYHVTDTFHLTYRDGMLRSVRTSSNDPPEFNQALDWLRQREPGLMTGACRGFFAGGPTPGNCVRAVVKGFAEFARESR